MKRMVYNYLKSNDLLNEECNDTANNFLKVFDKEIVISGNKLGLILLADYLVDVALSENNSHIHLDQDNFFDNAEMQLIIEKTNE